MGFREDLEQETVKDLPIRQAVLVKPDMSMREAVQAMRGAALGCAVVVDAEQRPTGLITEQGLLELLAEHESIDGRFVADCTEKDFAIVKVSDPIRRVWDFISGEGKRFICVLDNDGKLLGLTGQRGLSEYISEYFPQQVMVQRLGSKPWMQQREGA